MDNDATLERGWKILAIFIAINLFACIALLSAFSLPLPRIQLLYFQFTTLPIAALVGLAFHGIIAAVRRRFRLFLRSTMSVVWIGTTVAMIAAVGAINYVYSGVKIAVPLINPSLHDDLLWNLDRILGLGFSPNVLLLDLWGEWGLKAVDLTYGNVFAHTLSLTIIYFLGDPDNRRRLAFLLGSAVLWVMGCWLYLAIPALGPAYAYYDLWEPVRHLIPNTTRTQAMLMANYQRLLASRSGAPAPGMIHVLYGIAAFPSLHVGFHAFIAKWGSALYPRLRLLFWFALALIVAGSIVTGWHYAIDSVAGLLLGLGAFALAERIVPFRERYDQAAPPAARAEIQATEPTS